MSWRDAYLRQARSDYEMVESLNRTTVPICHRLHYLQMATEKLAKGFLSNGTDKPYKQTHFAIVKLLTIIKSNRQVREQLGYHTDYHAFCAYIDSIIDFAGRVEQLAPVGGGFAKLNPEYPWQNNAGAVQCPRDYDYPEFPRTDIIKFCRLIAAIFRIAA